MTIKVCYIFSLIQTFPSKILEHTGPGVKLQ